MACEALQIGQMPLKTGNIIARQDAATAVDDPVSSRDDTPAKRFVVDRRRDVVQQSQQPPADGGIANGISADLLDCGIKQVIQLDPRDYDPQHVWRIIEVCLRRKAIEPANEDAGKLVDAADRGTRIVDGG